MNKQTTIVGRLAVRQVAVALAICVSLSACAGLGKPHDTETDTVQMPASPSSVQTAKMKTTLQSGSNTAMGVTNN